MKNIAPYAVGALASVGFVFGILPHSPLECTDPDAREVIGMVMNGTDLKVDRQHLTIPLENEEYLSIYHALDSWGLGVARNAWAAPRDAEFSGNCRRAIYNAVRPLVDAWYKTVREDLL